MSPFISLNESDAHEKDVTLKDIVLFKALLPYIKPHWRPLLASFLILPLVAVTQVLQPVIVKQAIDGPIAEGNLAKLASTAGLFLVLVAVHYGLRYTQMVLAQITGQRIILSLRTALYDHLQSLPMGFYHKTPLGKLVTRISSDVENISEVFASGGIAIFSDFAVIIGIIIAMFWMNAPLAWTVMLIMPVVILTMEFFRRKSREIYNLLRVQLAHINSSLQETLTGMDVIQILRREKQNAMAFEQPSQNYMKTNMRSVVYDSSFTASVELLWYVTVLMVLGYIIWQQGSSQNMIVSFGLLVAFIQYIQMLFEPIEEISDKFTIIQSGLASVEKIMDLMQVPSEIQSPVVPVALEQSKGLIRFENVTFGYDPRHPVLINLNLEIQPGEHIAVIGATGAGKSTLIRLLNRQYDPQQGRILLDDVDIRTMALQEVRRNIVVIPQEEFLFSRTVEENITLRYKTPCNREKLTAVAEKVHANLVISRLEKGYDTVLAERGRNLSNGERQLLVFSRALWHNPAILVLDEATSAIDPQTEGLLQDALEKSLEGRTAIIIAHRLSTIQQVDRVVVIENGRIAESGSPAALYQQGGLYRAYYDHHFQNSNKM